MPEGALTDDGMPHTPNMGGVIASGDANNDKHELSSEVRQMARAEPDNGQGGTANMIIEPCQ